jgi:hypothetical protein
MEKKKFDRILNIIREQMAAGTGGFSGSSDPKGPVAGFDPVMGMAKRKKIIGLGRGSRKRWTPKKD